MGEVFRAFLKIGLTAFGGPVAHLAYFREEFVGRRRWLDDPAFADLVALAQFLPGPSSSQVGIALGFTRAGLPGAVAAWTGFTLPSAIVLTIAGLGFAWPGPAGIGMHGLKLVAVPVVAQAIVTMARTLSRGGRRASITLVAAAAALTWPGPRAQAGVLALGALAGWLGLRRLDPGPTAMTAPRAWSKRAGVICLSLFAALMLASPALPAAIGRLMRATALVFGGGHVVLPMLKSEFLASGLLSPDQVMSGYALAQAVPGPLFSIAAYYGAVIGGVGLAVGYEIAAFLPAFLLVLGAWPFWNILSRSAAARSIAAGLGAAVVGLLMAAFYDPVWTGAVGSIRDLGLAAAGFVMLERFRVPPWAVVLSIALLA